MSASGDNSAPLRIGLLGASRIAAGAVIEPSAEVDGVEVGAIAARDVARARAAADQHDIAVVHDSYDALLADDDIDIVYVASPASLHREQSVAVLEAGRHLLVEKPLAANAADGQRIADAAARRPDLVAMEAMHSRHHPVYDLLVELLTDGLIGRVQHVEAGFTAPLSGFAAADIRWDLSLGGGALMDLGVYPLTWVRHLLGDDLAVEHAQAAPAPPEVGGDQQVDATLTARLRRTDGVTASVVCSMDAPDDAHRSWLRIDGTRATLELTNPTAPQRGATLTHIARDGTPTALGVPPGSTYVRQLTALRDAILHGEPVRTTIAEGVATMRLIDACYQAAGLQVRPAR